jgi:hypothetical protein
MGYKDKLKAGGFTVIEDPVDDSKNASIVDEESSARRLLELDLNGDSVRELIAAYNVILEKVLIPKHRNHDVSVDYGINRDPLTKFFVSCMQYKSSMTGDWSVNYRRFDDEMRRIAKQ